MYCSKCGKQIPDGSTFCSHCGHKIISNNPGDNLRKGIFSVGRALKGFAIRLAVCAVICIGSPFIFTKFSKSLIENPPVVSKENVEIFKDSCMDRTLEYRTLYAEKYKYNYIKSMPESVVGRWKYDDEMQERFRTMNTYDTFDGDINDMRRYYFGLKDVDNTYNFFYILIALSGIYLFFYIGNNFYKWLYKNN